MESVESDESVVQTSKFTSRLRINIYVHLQFVPSSRGKPAALQQYIQFSIPRRHGKIKHRSFAWFRFNEHFTSVALNYLLYN